MKRILAAAIIGASFITAAPARADNQLDGIAMFVAGKAICTGVNMPDDILDVLARQWATKKGIYAKDEITEIVAVRALEIKETVEGNGKKEALCDLVRASSKKMGF